MALFTSDFGAFGSAEASPRVEEEEEVSAGIDASFNDDCPTVVILNGLHLEDGQCVCLSLNAWIGID